MHIGILVALIVLNGVFAMSEIALVTARRSRLKKLADEGDKAAATALRLKDEPTRFLSTIQIGITAIGLLSGIMGEAALSVPLAGLLARAGLSGQTASIAATIVVVAAITMFSIVVGELVPKRIGQTYADTIARLMARPVSALAQLGRPFVYVLTFFTERLLRLLGKTQGEPYLTEEDIEAVIADGSRAGVIEQNEHELVRNAFRLDDRLIASLMTPKSEAVYLDVDQPLESVMDSLINSNHSRFPVCRGGLGDVLGIISAKRLLKRFVRGETGDIEEYLQPAVFVPETLNGMQLLEQLRQSGAKMVFVVDEYGEVLGLITLQNVLEALAGEFTPRDPEDLWAVRREDGSWLLDGLIPIPELKDRLGLKSVPEESKGMYNTLGGMMMWLKGSIPRTGDISEWEHWKLEVVDLDGNRVDKVLASRIGGGTRVARETGQSH